jgi:hypothetical protein
MAGSLHLLRDPHARPGPHFDEKSPLSSDRTTAFGSTVRFV